MTGFGVDPALLAQAAVNAKMATKGLAHAETVRSQAEFAAARMHYQPAAGMAMAVAQKINTQAGLTEDVITALAQGLAKASGDYAAVEEKIGNAAGGGVSSLTPKAPDDTPATPPQPGSPPDGGQSTAEDMPNKGMARNRYE